MNYDEELEDRLEQQIFSKTLNELIRRSGKSFREIAKDLNLPDSSFFDMRCGSRTYKYSKLRKIADYFRVILNDEKITLSFIMFGSDEIRESMQNKIQELEEQIRKERATAAWREIELKAQLDMFKNEENN